MMILMKEVRKTTRWSKQVYSFFYLYIFEGQKPYVSDIIDVKPK